MFICLGTVSPLADRGVDGLLLRIRGSSTAFVFLLGCDLGSLTENGVEPMNLMKAKSHPGREGGWMPDKAKALNDGGPVCL